MKAGDFLKQAKETMDKRGETYDEQHNSVRGTERSMGKTIKAFNAITGRSLSEEEGWLIMLLLKQVRQWSTLDYHHDSAMDAVAYAALLAESMSADAELPDSANIREVIQAAENAVRDPLYNGLGDDNKIGGARE